MQTFSYIILATSVLSLISFLVRLLNTKNMFLIGKIISRAFLIFETMLYIKHTENLEYIFLGIIVVNISDILYDLTRYLVYTSINKNIKNKYLSLKNFKNSPIPLFVVDKKENRIIFVNDQFETELKIEKDFIINKTLSEVFPNKTLNQICNESTIFGFKSSCFNLDNGKNYIVFYLY